MTLVLLSLGPWGGTLILYPFIYVSFIWKCGYLLKMIDTYDALLVFKVKL